MPERDYAADWEKADKEEGTHCFNCDGFTTCALMAEPGWDAGVRMYLCKDCYVRMGKRVVEDD